MALTISYELPAMNFTINSTILRATNWWTVFTNIPWNSTNFDLFTDTAVADDAIYFCVGEGNILPAGLKFNIWTAISATSYELVWEYYKYSVWRTAIEDIVDETNSFSVTWVHYIKFPQQRQSTNININWTWNYRLWIRCRIVSANWRTEWWANQTDVVKYWEWKLTLSWTDDAHPASFQDIYDWIIVNQPHISIQKHDWYYDFRKVWITINSRLVSNNEIIELWPDTVWNNRSGVNNFAYIQSWTKIDNNTGIWWSTFIIHWVHNQRVFNLSDNSKLYWATLRTGKRASDTKQYAWYCDLLWEIIDCNIELSARIPSSELSFINNVRINSWHLVTTWLKWTFSNIDYICNYTQLFHVYRDSVTLDWFWYKFTNPSTSSVFYIYLWSDRVSQERILTNPSIPLNNKTTRPYPASLSYSIQNIWYMKYYNSSDWTYTDYTTQANNTTTNDVPLSWNVWDILYFGSWSTYIPWHQYWFSLHLTRTSWDNDSQYVREYYYDGAWREVWEDWIWDWTDNLSKTWAILLAVPYNMQNYTTTIDWITTCRIRARIVWTASTPQYWDRLRRFTGGFISNWTVKEKYSVNISVIDEDWNPIDTANVIMNNEYGEEVFNVNTDVNWDITTQYLLSKKFYLDVNQTDYIGQKIYTYVDLEIKKDWYETYRTRLWVSEKVDTVITLKSSKKYLVDDRWDIYQNTDPENITTSLYRLRKT